MDDIKNNKNFILNKLTQQDKKTDLNSTSSLSNKKKLALALLSASTILAGSMDALAHNWNGTNKTLKDGGGGVVADFDLSGDQAINLQRALTGNATLTPVNDISGQALEIDLGDHSFAGHTATLDANGVSNLKIAKVVKPATQVSAADRFIIDVAHNGNKNLVLDGAAGTAANFAGIGTIKLGDGSLMTISNNDAELTNVTFQGTKGKIKADTKSLKASLAAAAEFDEIEIGAGGGAQTVTFSGANLTVNAHSGTGVNFAHADSTLSFSTEHSNAPNLVTFQVDKFTNANDDQGKLELIAVGKDLKVKSDLKGQAAADTRLKEVSLIAEDGKTISFDDGKNILVTTLKVNDGAETGTVDFGKTNITFQGADAEIKGGVAKLSGNIVNTGGANTLQISDKAEFSFKPHTKATGQIDFEIKGAAANQGQLTLDSTDKEILIKKAIGGTELEKVKFIAAKNITIEDGNVVKAKGFEFAGNGTLSFGHAAAGTSAVTIGADHFKIGAGNGKVVFKGAVTAANNGKIVFTKPADGKSNAQLVFNPQAGNKSVANTITTEVDGTGEILVDLKGGQNFTFQGSVGVGGKPNPADNLAINKITVQGVDANAKEVVFANTAAATVAVKEGITLKNKDSIKFGATAGAHVLDVYSNVNFEKADQNTVTFDTTKANVTLQGSIGTQDLRANKVVISNNANATNVKGNIYAKTLNFGADGQLNIESIGNGGEGTEGNLDPTIRLKEITNVANQGKILLTAGDNRTIDFEVKDNLAQSLNTFKTDGTGTVKFTGVADDFVLATNAQIEINANTELTAQNWTTNNNGLELSKDVTFTIKPTKGQLKNFTSANNYQVANEITTATNEEGTYVLDLSEAENSFKTKFADKVGDSAANKLKNLTVKLNSSAKEVIFGNQLGVHELNITKPENAETIVQLSNNIFVGKIAENTNIAFQQADGQNVTLADDTNISGANYKLLGNDKLTLGKNVKVGKITNAKKNEGKIILGDGASLSENIGTADQRFNALEINGGGAAAKATFSGDLYLANGLTFNNAGDVAVITGSVVDFDEGMGIFGTVGPAAQGNIHFGKEGFSGTQKIIAGSNVNMIVFEGAGATFDHSSANTTGLEATKVGIKGSGNTVLLGANDIGAGALEIGTDTDDSNMIKLGADFAVGQIGEASSTLKHIDLNNHKIRLNNQDVYTRLIGGKGTIEFANANPFTIAGVGESSENRFGGTFNAVFGGSYTFTRGFHVSKAITQSSTFVFQDDASVAAMGSTATPITELNFLKDANLSGNIHADKITHADGVVTVEKNLKVASDDITYNGSTIDLKNNLYQVAPVNKNNKAVFDGDITLKTTINSTQDYGNIEVADSDISKVRSVTYEVEVNPDYLPDDGTEFKFAHFLTSSDKDIVVRSNTLTQRMIPGSFTAGKNNGSLIIKTGLTKEIVNDRAAAVSGDVRATYKAYLTQLINTNNANNVTDSFKKTVNAFGLEQERAEYITKNVEAPTDALGTAARLAESAANQMSETVNTRQSEVAAVASRNIVAAGDHEGTEARYGAWIRGIYSSGKQESSTSMSGFDTTSGGFVLGADAGFGDSNSVGVAYGYMSGEAKFKGLLDGAKNDVKSHIFSLYGTYYFNDCMYATGAFSMSNSDIKMKSTRVNSAGQTENVKNDTNSKRFSMQMLGHYRYAATDNMDLVPFAGFGFTRTAQNAFSDKIDGSDGYVKMKDNTFNDGNVILGASVQTNMEVAETPMLFAAHVAYNYYFNDKFGKADLTLAEVPLSVDIKRGGNSVFDFGVDLTANVTEMLNVGGAYNVRLSDKYANHTGALKVKVNF